MSTQVIGLPLLTGTPAVKLLVEYDSPWQGGAVGLAAKAYRASWDYASLKWLDASGVQLVIPLPRVASNDPGLKGTLRASITVTYPSLPPKTALLTLAGYETSAGVLDLTIDPAPIQWTTAASLSQLIANATNATAAIPGQVAAGLSGVAPALAQMTQALANDAQTLALLARISGITPWTGGDHTTIPSPAGDYLITRGIETRQVWSRDANAGPPYRNSALEVALQDQADAQAAALLNALQPEPLPYGALAHIQARLALGLSITVVFLGDSITQGTRTNNLADDADGWARRLEAQLLNLLPGRVTVYNRGIGARSIANFLDPNYKGIAYSASSGVGDGYTMPWSVVGETWQTAVSKLTPDLVICAFGMNPPTAADADVAESTNLPAALTLFSAYAKVPDVIAVAPFVPTSGPNQTADPEYILATIRAKRAVAHERGVAYVEADRLYSIFRNGNNDTLRAATVIEKLNDVTFATADWAGDKGLFSVSGTNLAATSPGGSIQRVKSFRDGSIDWGTYITSASQATRLRYRRNLELVFRPEGNDGAARVDLAHTASSGAYTILASRAAPLLQLNAFRRISVQITEDRHQVWMEGTQVMDFRTPYGQYDGPVQVGAITQSTSIPGIADLLISFRDRIQFGAAFSEAVLIGLAGGVVGNGINHPTGLGHALFYLAGFTEVLRGLSMPVNPPAISATAPRTVVIPQGANTSLGNSLRSCLLLVRDVGTGKSAVLFYDVNQPLVIMSGSPEFRLDYGPGIYLLTDASGVLAQPIGSGVSNPVTLSIAEVRA